jgi:hypothetical protein
VSISQLNSALDDMFELTDVARPVVSDQRRHGLRRNFPGSGLMKVSIGIEEGIDQEGNVGSSLAKRRKKEPDGAQAGVQVLTEGAGRHFARILMTGRNQAEIDASVRPVSPDPLKLARFEQANQAGLHSEAHLVEAVQKQGPVRRQLQQAGLLAVGAWKAAPQMPEQL